ncbi:zinc finger CCCH domain-containing protein 41-like [Populus alba x Populus x berolinensis]|nr:zinc finger CCCH domain-containing protein 41-like [Populus alba x Populus x berolinensis]
MELKVSPLETGGLSPADCISDPEEKEVSDEEDDDRNHKHRRRETRSQSLERDSLEPVSTRPYRKHNKHFENGHPFRENESQARETWKNYNSVSLEKDFATKFERIRPDLMSLPRMPVDLNQRIRLNQTFSGDPGPSRGRGRESGSWSQRDSRFSSVGIASQMAHLGPNLFAGRGLANVSNVQSASWNAFGLMPRMSNGGLDALHPIGLQGTLRPAVNSSLNMGIPHQRCRDFEERGFCLRGDMCPLEHGVNRIVVEDVQSLSQFNLPVSLPRAQLPGTTSGMGAVPTVGAPPATLMNSKGMHGKSNKPGIVDDGLGLNGAYTVSASVSGGDLYDPDQPLWNDNGPETSSTLLAPHSPKFDDTESMISVDPSDHNHARLRDGADNECPIRSTGIAVGFQGMNSSVWGRIGALNNRLDVKEKIDSTVSMSSYTESESKEDQGALDNVHGTSRQGKRTNFDDCGTKTMDSPAKIHSDTMRHMRKPSQKALRTLFVNGIPHKSNKRDTLLSHFQKFGEVIDIYIPLNSERAFIQFSKREEAEAALRAPDAVMGNRFIRLWWANRDSIPDDATSRGVPATSALPHLSIGNGGKDNLQLAISKTTVVPTSDTSTPTTDHPKVDITNGPEVSPPMQKKLESLEQLKEELRKKQELLDQKRNDFRRQLHKLEKQATGVKGEVATEPASKRQKTGIASDVAKSTTTRSADPGAGVASPHAGIVDKNKRMENIVSSSTKTSTVMALQDSAGSKQSIHPLAPVGPPFLMNKYKLDNRPTAFKIISPLPAGLANVAALKEHFSSYGYLSSVELEDEPGDYDGDGSDTVKSCSARVTFTTRRSAERAFLNGKCWQGKNLKFEWLMSSTSSVGENSSAPKCLVHADVQPVKKLARLDSQEVSASGNGEPENPERNNGANPADLDKVSQCCSASISGEVESPKCEPSPKSISPEKESTKEDPSQTAMSEKETPEGIFCLTMD